MIRRLLRVCGLTLGALAIAGCSESSLDNEPQTPPNPPLYEISNADGDVEGWMLGTIHALPDGVEWRTDAIEGVIDRADFAIVEVANLNDSTAISSVFTVLAVTSQQQPELPERVNEELKTPLYELIAKSDYSDYDFSATETWAAALMLARTQSTGDPANGVDRAIISDFADRSVIELEGALNQLRIFDGLDEEDQRALLEGVVTASIDEESDPAQLRNAWLTGDNSVLEEATRTGIMADPELHQALIQDRNEDWAEKIEVTLAKPAKPLIAVGAGHLVGANSLNSMLEARGFTVRRIEQIPLP
ncbi:TraB/GumN family protein [Erythrobacter crassostreae]|uniref:TraB/GumN family protein n=1 Tax=Erythrobacter crassostreae TaxID=2828328 RepID=A0A9X1F476_9SPHN|nr:TraB/GumN family protein [Erythrobacter crassostrea]MBV7259947.1 TraB/GumN family protein [Erythrobacter crassostrea]